MEDRANASAAAEPEARPPRRRGVGPFSLRQVAGALGIVIVAAILLTIGTAPLGSTTPGLPNPVASAYLLRSAVPGLQVGQLAPELTGTTDTGAAFELTDLDGKLHEEEAEGLFATCIQHEIDHLNGVLFVDYLSKLKRDRVLKKFTKAAKRAE